MSPQEEITTQVALIRQEIGSLSSRVEVMESTQKELASTMTLGKGVLIAVLFIFGTAGLAFGRGLKQWLG